MSENNSPSRPVRAKAQRGSAAVEFAIIVIVFLTMIFGVMEMARALYMFNILQEVTRRAAVLAASANFDQDTQDEVRARALFSGANGKLILGEPVTSAHLKIDYLSIARDSGTGALTPQVTSPMPACPERNQLNCVADPYGASCIRLVRVRVCQPGSGAECTPVPYRMLFPLINMSSVTLPRSETIVPAQTLGYTFGSIPCP